MGMILHVDSPDFIDAVNDVIHDCWFAVDGILFDAAASQLSIPFEFALPPSATKKTHRQGSMHQRHCRGLLRFTNVLSYVLEDTEKVGRYDFNRIEYDPASGIIRVMTNIPLFLGVRVRTLEVTVEIS